MSRTRDWYRTPDIGRRPASGLLGATGNNTLADLDATEFLKLLRRRSVSVSEYVAALADRIEAIEPRLHAWAWFDRAALERRARLADERLARDGVNGRLPGPLWGVPVGVKDIFNTYDMPTGMGSEILAGYTPGNDARVVSNIRLAGGLIAGKTVTAEFAVHHPGPTVNPYDSRRSPGTSSSGSAAAVAARMVPLALASQTAGSIIRPASYCGVVGFKPSFGLVPRTGVLKTTDTLDTIGLMGRSVEDVALAFETLRVHGHNYPILSSALADPDRRPPVDRPWRVGVVKAPTDRVASASALSGLATLADRLASEGHDVTEFRLTSPLDRAHEVHERIYRRALSYYFKSEWQSAAHKFSPRLAAMIEGGLAITPEDYGTALDEQARMSRAFDAMISSYDVLLCLSTAGEAPIGLETEDPPDTCLVWTLLGAPTISLPLLQGDTGLPVGAQLISRRYGDYKLLSFAKFALSGQ